MAVHCCIYSSLACCPCFRCPRPHFSLDRECCCPYRVVTLLCFSRLLARASRDIHCATWRNYCQVCKEVNHAHTVDSLPLWLPISWLVLPFPVVLVCYACLASASASSNPSYNIWWEILPALRILCENTCPEYCRSLVLKSLCVILQLLLVEGGTMADPAGSDAMQDLLWQQNGSPSTDGRDISQLRSE